jgi:hypothetical protein
VKKSRDVNRESWKNENTLPCRTLLPCLVTALITAPVARPYSASNW